ncbi:HAD-IIA family hydrolase [Butyrivibrio sp. INlla16]|uniref:HAD-IIA family hydrolase n=1 Tax=Butyrivibrio sp. INlla16 TaxID=1520807 RepID=UPI0008833659|nr:HAD-IIA family hydrolase [Butyrivibrio sp. INlla16]SDB17121.1 HAD-hyrolase-like [Butyrivibrio sp. INlla16]
MNKELSLEQDFEKLCNCQLFLLDMDGTLYLGDEVFDGAIDFIHTLEKLGKKYIYLTNNSSRAGIDYVDRLKKLGFPCEIENVYTSGMATAEYLKKNYGNRDIYVVGTRTFYDELKNSGLNVFNATDHDSSDYGDVFPVVCVGFDTELVYRDLDLAVHFLRKGSEFIAANPDWVCPMPAGEVLPDCGSICALLTASSGSEPTYIGKPNRNMVDIISTMTNIDNAKICCVGDRLYTDIAVAQNAGSVSVCVLSGECNEAEIADMDKKPDYVLDNVAELADILFSHC